MYNDPSINIIDKKFVETGSEVLTLDEVKTQLAIALTNTDFDTELTAMIKRCRARVENWCGISIIQKTVTLVADFYKEWEIPYGPVIGLVSVQTRSSNEGSGGPVYATKETGWNIDGEEYKTFIPFGFLADDLFTNNRGCPPLRFRLVYTAGYVTVPEDLKLGILNEIAYRYENKGDNSDEIKSPAVIDLISSFKRMSNTI